MATKSSPLTKLIPLLFAGVAAYVAYLNWPKTEPTPELFEMVVAQADIPVGAIDPEQLAVVRFPRTLQPHLPADHFTTIEALKGKIARQPVYKGEILIERRVLQDPGGSPLAALLGPNQRAVTVRVDDVSGVAGFLLPGSLVDVISIPRQGEAQIVLQKLRILAVDQKLDAGSEKNAVQVRAVTLAATPREAVELAQVSETGAVRLALRNPADDGPVAAVPEAPPLTQPVVETRDGITRDGTVSPPPVVAAVPEPELVTVEIVRGIERSTVSVKR